ncbi:MAG TPA: HEAT repeat domain-containing protein [Candidatus Sulfotelmatobacter sp.]|nr:HEAT repeat domain-containing protein [Candidatus Sulfotelmatobacter sp.]
MRITFLATWSGACALLTVAGPPQQNAAPPARSSSNAPKVQSSRLSQQPAAGSLAAQLTDWTAQVTTPQWAGYSVPEVAGNRGICCSGGDWNGGDCGTCRLENGEHGVNVMRNDSDATVMLEGSREIAVLFRAENHQITKIRMASTECTLDAGGLLFLWLTNVKPAESVALLTTFVRNDRSGYRDDDDRHGHQALSAIALHADDSAEIALESFVGPDSPDELRKQTAFWLGEARGKAGFIALQKMAKSDPSTDVRAHVTFALSVSREPGAIDEMIRMAHDDQSTHVRGQALFWLAQKAGKKEAAAITDAIENDPDTEVKKKAVFALSQMPKDEGVPKLIQVAETNRNPAVRKQAMFWLGQSNDPRALAFFEKVLSQ